MGKTIFAAVISAVFAAIATVLVMDSFHTEKAATDAAARESAEATTRVERERLDRRIVEIEKRLSAAPRVERRSSNDAAPAATVEGAVPATAPDGTPYVSRAELEAFAKTRGVGDAPAKIDAAPAARPAKKSLEEIAREQNLSAAEEANLRIILRESEEEMVRSLFGDKPLADVQRELLEAKEDPDKQAALMQGVIQNAIGNMGKLMTLENRTKKKVEGVLGPERAKKFLDTPRTSVIAPEFEEVLKGTFSTDAR